MVTDPIIDIPSRQREESSIVVKWLQRLHESVREEPGNLFAEAVNRSGLSYEQLRSGEGLTHYHFDLVMEFIGRSVPDLTFRFIERLELLDLGMHGYAILSCDTVKKAQELMSRYMDLTSDRYTEKRIMDDDFLIIRPVPTWRHLGEDQSIAEDCLGGNWHAIQLMLGPSMDYYGASAHFAYPAPAHAAAYEDFFRPASVHFNARQSELRLPTKWLNRRLATANVMMSDVTAAVCERMLGPGQSSRIDTPRAVRRLLLSRPGQRMLRLEEAADEMTMSTAQLRKRLYRAGTSYKSIVLEVRMGLAQHYLESTHLSIQEIAYLLDYAQPGPFSRAFKKYFGDSPRTVRNQSLEISSPAS